MLCLKAHQEASFVQFELESAVCEEDFKEAARLKAILNEATVKDPVSEVFTELTVYSFSSYSLDFHWLTLEV